MSLQKLSHTFTKIVFIALRTNLFHIVLLPFLLTLSSLKTFSQELPKKNISISTDKQEDKILLGKKITTKEQDSTKNDTVKKKKELLDEKIDYNSKEYKKINKEKK